MQDISLSAESLISLQFHQLNLPFLAYLPTTKED